MKLPSRYENHSTKVAKLLRPIYDLEQSGRNWNNEIDEFLTTNEFKRLQANSLFILMAIMLSLHYM